MKSITAFLVIIGVAACGDSVGPEPPLDLRIEAFPRTVAVGDSVRFIAFAYNPTDQTIDLSMGCGLSLDVIVTPPEGEDISVYEDMLSGGVPTCQHEWYHEADPGELIELQFSWETPPIPGTYRAVTETRCGEEWCPASKAIKFTVR